MMSSFCSCEESDQKHFSDDVFPNAEQIWGMIGTIIATFACWVLYTKLKIRRERLLPPRVKSPSNVGQSSNNLHSTSKRQAEKAQLRLHCN